MVSWSGLVLRWVEASGTEDVVGWSGLVLRWVELDDPEVLVVELDGPAAPVDGPLRCRAHPTMAGDRGGGGNAIWANDA